MNDKVPMGLEPDKVWQDYSTEYCYRSWKEETDMLDG